MRTPEVLVPETSVADMAAPKHAMRGRRARRALVAAGLLAMGVAGALLAAPVSAQTPPDPAPTPTSTPTSTPPSTPAPTSTPRAPATADIEPIVECSFLDPGTGLYNTVWGYKNSGAKDESLPVGSTNSFDNPGANAGQPTVFKKGRAQNAFIVTHKGSSTWTLAGRTATAPSGACRTNPVPVVSEGAGGLITIIVVTVVLGLCAFVRFRPRRA